MDTPLMESPPPETHPMIRACGGDTSLAAALIVAAGVDNETVQKAIEHLVVAVTLADGDSVAMVKADLDEQVAKRRAYDAEKLARFRSYYMSVLPIRQTGIIGNFGS